MVGPPARVRAKVVGTYRLLRQEVAERHFGFYTAKEFDIAPLIARHPPGKRFLELGRSCVLAPYRNRRTVELLWQASGPMCCITACVNVRLCQPRRDGYSRA